MDPATCAASIAWATTAQNIAGAVAAAVVGYAFIRYVLGSII